MRARNAINLLRETVQRLKDDLENGMITDAAIMEAKKALEVTQFITYEQDKLPALLKGK